MGCTAQGEKSLSPKTQKNDSDYAIRNVINKRSDTPDFFSQLLFG